MYIYIYVYIYIHIYVCVPETFSSKKEDTYIIYIYIRNTKGVIQKKKTKRQK